MPLVPRLLAKCNLARLQGSPAGYRKGSGSCQAYTALTVGMADKRCHLVVDDMPRAGEAFIVSLQCGWGIEVMHKAEK